MLSALTAAALEKLINAALTTEPALQASLIKLQGRIIAVHIKGFEQTWYCRVRVGEIEVLRRLDVAPDVIIAALPGALIKLAAADDALALLQSGEVEMSGDVRMGQQFKDLMANIDIDWEELLAQKVGDIPAHQIGQAVRGFQSWLRRSVDSVNTTTGEYLQEEVRFLPTALEINDFLSKVDYLRSDVERLAARLNRLKSLQP